MRGLRPLPCYFRLLSFSTGDPPRLAEGLTCRPPTRHGVAAAAALALLVAGSRSTPAGPAAFPSCAHLGSGCTREPPLCPGDAGAPARRGSARFPVNALGGEAEVSPRAELASVLGVVRGVVVSLLAPLPDITLASPQPTHLLPSRYAALDLPCFCSTALAGSPSLRAESKLRGPAIRAPLSPRHPRHFPLLEALRAASVS